MDIEKLKRLAESATPGPWVVGACYADNGQVTAYGIYYQEGRGVFSEVGISEPDADYIAAANPAAILELIRQMECLEYAAEANKTLLLESRQNDYQAMAWLAECRFAVGDDGKRMLPEFVEHLKSLERQRDELLAALKEYDRLATETTDIKYFAVEAWNFRKIARQAIANAEKQS